MPAQMPLHDATLIHRVAFHANDTVQLHAGSHRTSSQQPRKLDSTRTSDRAITGIMATYTADMLARHATLATFTGFEQGREPMLRVFPPRPAKSWATFQIDE